MVDIFESEPQMFVFKHQHEKFLSAPTMVRQWVCVPRLLILFSTAFYWNLFETKIGFSIS